MVSRRADLLASRWSHELAAFQQGQPTDGACMMADEFGFGTKRPCSTKVQQPM
jgi:hypothetical protein